MIAEPVKYVAFHGQLQYHLDMKKKRIKDNPTFAKPLRDIDNMLAIQGAMPYLAALGVDTKQVQASLGEVRKIRTEMEHLSQMPDRFNGLFAQRGWVIYDSMNADVAMEAITKAEAGDIDGGEEALVDYYNADTVQIHLLRMNAVQAFRPRVRLAEKALDDYREERYHACVPVVIMLLDGMVNDINQKRGQKKGFHTDSVDLEAWDSIAAHSTGLMQLRSVICASRTKTTTEPISIPFRHGIMHGMDIGYDTRIVAAKAWAALFAVREWAVLAEQGRLGEQSEKPEPTLNETIEILKDVAERKKLLDNWQPRNLQPGIHFLPDGLSKDYGEGTPERKLVEFFQWWQAKNYGYMAACIMKMLQIKPSQVKTEYQGAQLESYQIVDIKDKAAALTEITVKLIVNRSGERQEGIVDMGLICQDAEGETSIRGQEGGEWWVQNWGHPVNCLSVDCS